MNEETGFPVESTLSLLFFHDSLTEDTACSFIQTIDHLGDSIWRGFAADGLRRYFCGICGYMSPFSTNVRNHIASKHTGEKRFACSFCPKRYRQNVAKMSHEQTKHGQVRRETYRRNFNWTCSTLIRIREDFIQLLSWIYDLVYMRKKSMTC